MSEAAENTGGPTAFEEQIAQEVDNFLLSLRSIAEEGDASRGISLLLLEISQILLTGARLGAMKDVALLTEYQPDVGREADPDGLRMALADMLGDLDTYSFVFDPYQPETVESQLSDDLVSVASDLENGLRHYRRGDIPEALWWWQFSYVSNWGNLAGAALNALWSVVSHDRLDVDETVDADQVEAADEMLTEHPVL